MKTPGYEILEGDLVEALLAGSPLTAVDFATSLAEDLIAVMANEGWLVEAHICEYGWGGTKVNACDRPTRPGRSYCEEHS